MVDNKCARHGDFWYRALTQEDQSMEYLIKGPVSFFSIKTKSTLYQQNCDTHKIEKTMLTTKSADGVQRETRPRGYKTFFVLNSVEHEI